LYQDSIVKVILSVESFISASTWTRRI